MDFAHRQVSLSPTEGMVTEGGEVSEGDQGSQKQMIKAESLDEEGSRGGEKAIVEVQPLLVASSNKVYTCTYMYILYSVYILQVKFYIYVAGFFFNFVEANARCSVCYAYCILKDFVEIIFANISKFAK